MWYASIIKMGTEASGQNFFFFGTAFAFCETCLKSLKYIRNLYTQNLCCVGESGTSVFHFNFIGKIKSNVPSDCMLWQAVAFQFFSVLRLSFLVFHLGHSHFCVVAVFLKCANRWGFHFFCPHLFSWCPQGRKVVYLSHIFLPTLSFPFACVL